VLIAYSPVGPTTATVHTSYDVQNTYAGAARFAGPQRYSLPDFSWMARTSTQQGRNSRSGGAHAAGATCRRSPGYIADGLPV